MVMTSHDVDTAGEPVLSRDDGIDAAVLDVVNRLIVRFPFVERADMTAPSAPRSLVSAHRVGRVARHSRWLVEA
jgi:hypothetical protein